jgi:hypothetical protein
MRLANILIIQFRDKEITAALEETSIIRELSAEILVALGIMILMGDDLVMMLPGQRRMYCWKNFDHCSITFLSMTFLLLVYVTVTKLLVLMPVQ